MSPPVLVSSAVQLLWEAASSAPRREAIQRLIDAPVDWDELCTLAQQERCESPLLRAIGPGRAGAAPGFAQLRQLATASVIRMLRLEQILHQTLDGLTARGIQVVLLKGAGLAYTAYPSFTDRPMGDLDLLIRPADARQAWAWLQEQEWSWPAEWNTERYTGHQHLPPLMHPDGFRLEVHTQLLAAGHPFRLTDDEVWARAQTASRSGRDLLTPHVQHQLWHACVHFAWSHEMLWGAWRALRDSAAIGQRGVDWDAFVRLAGETRAATCCYWTLRLSKRLAATAVPEDVLEALRPHRSEFVLEKLERHFVSNLFATADRCPSVWLTHRLWEAGIRPGASGHGPARPWHVAERWEGGAAQPASRSVRQPLGQRVRRLGAWWTYFNRLRRFALPTGPITGTHDRI